MTAFLKEKGPGLALAAALGAIAMLAAPHVPRVGAVPLAILLGIAVSAVRAPGARLGKGIGFAEKTVLAAAVVLLGVKLDLGLLSPLGGAAIALVVGVVVVTLLLGAPLARLLGLPGPLGVLLGVGSAICGTSAIAAAAPLVAEDGEQIGLSIAVVNLLGTVGMFIVPAIALALSLGEPAGALLVGGSLQAVGHVVAAGFALSDTVGRTATAVKMGRVFLLAPLILALGLLKGRTDRADATSPRRRGGRLPGYLYGFVLLAVLASLGWLPARAVDPLDRLGKVLLAVAMAGVGLRIEVRSLIRRGPRALLAGALLFACQLACLLAALLIAA